MSNSVDSIIGEYKKLYKEQFQSLNNYEEVIDEVNKINSYSDLFEDIKEKYKNLIYDENIDKVMNRIAVEKVKVNDKLSRNYFVNTADLFILYATIIVTFIAAIIGSNFSAFISTIGELNFLNDFSAAFKTYVVISVFNAVLVFLLILFILCRKHDVKSKKNKTGYNLICLAVLDALEKEVIEKKKESDLEASVNELEKHMNYHEAKIEVLTKIINSKR